MNKEIEPTLLNGQIMFLVQDVADIARVVDLENVSFHGNGEDIYTLAMITKVGWIIATKNDNEILTGAIEVLPTRNPNEAFIHGLCIREEDRGKGIGAKLMQKTLKLLEEECGIKRFSATVSPTNGPSLNILMNKNGFEGTSFYPNFYGRGEDRLFVHRAENGRSSECEPMYVLGTDTEALHHFVNEQRYRVIGVKRPDNPTNNNFLILRR